MLISYNSKRDYRLAKHLQLAMIGRAYKTQLRTFSSHLPHRLISLQPSYPIFNNTFLS